MAAAPACGLTTQRSRWQSKPYANTAALRSILLTDCALWRF